MWACERGAWKSDAGAPRPPPGIPVTVPAMPVATLFRAAFPFETESFALVLVDSTTDSRTGATVPGVRADADGNTWATLQLIVRD